MNQIEKNILRCFLIIIGCIILLNLNGQSMEKYRWENRILIVKTSSEQNSKYQEQLKEFDKSNTELKERKLILFEVVGNKYRKTDFQKLKNNKHWQKISEIDRDAFGSLNKFEVLLIGLDGGVKLKKMELLKKEELFRIIDRMPMRREELRAEERNKKEERN